LLTSTDLVSRTARTLRTIYLYVSIFYAVRYRLASNSY
jgi:hypothetical protein